MPLLQRPVFLTAEDLQAAWTEVWPRDASPRFEFQETAFTFDAAGQQGGGVIMPAPIPNDEVLGPARTSWLWPTALDDLLGYAAHIVVFASSAKSALSAFQMMTKVATAVVTASGALGVYVGGGGMVVKAGPFVSLAQQDPVPIPLWIDLRCTRGPDGSSSLFTVGLSQFGMMELEIPSSTKSCGELRMWTMNIAAWLVEELPVIHDGDTVGLSADDRVRVTRADSIIERPGPVWRLSGG